MVLIKMQAGQEQDGLPRRTRGSHVVHSEVTEQRHVGHRIDVGPPVVEEREAQGIAILTQGRGEQSRGIITQLGNESAWAIVKYFTNLLPGMGKFLKSQPVHSTSSPRRLRTCQSSPVPNIFGKIPSTGPLYQSLLVNKQFQKHLENVLLT